MLKGKGIFKRIKRKRTGHAQKNLPIMITYIINEGVLQELMLVASDLYVANTETFPVDSIQVTNLFTLLINNVLKDDLEKWRPETVG